MLNYSYYTDITLTAHIICVYIDDDMPGIHLYILHMCAILCLWTAIVRNSNKQKNVQAVKGK